MTDLERAHCAVTARWLEANLRVASTLGLGAVAALVAWALLRPHPPAWAWTVLALAPVERLLALRLHFDAGLFADLGASRLTLAGLDSGLELLRLRRASRVPRPLARRVAGAHALAWQHGATAAVQAALLITAWSLAT